MKCPTCSHDNPLDAVTCSQCGELLADIDGETVVDAGRESSAAQSDPGSMPTEYVASDEATERPDDAPSGTPASASSGSASGRTSPTSGTKELLPHTVFGGRYEILGLLGEGGMGMVYKALDRELDKVIALKTIRASMGNDPDIVKRFKQELLLARKVTHKNVVRIHDLSEAEGVKFFTMEFIDGKSLKQLIRDRGRVPVDEALAIAKPILGALQEAHAQGVVHRDLKPQNIIIDKSGEPLIMDFGIARSAVDTGGMTDTGAVIGTPDYMSPEQVRGDKANAPADLFAFGVILYEMLTGELPYKADTAVSKVMMRLTHRPRAPRDINVDIPKYVEGVILKSMEIDPELRYQSAGEILHDLEREQVSRSITLRVQKAVASRKWAVAAAIVLAGLVAIVTVDRSPDEPPSPPVSDIAPKTVAILPFTNAAGSQELEWMRTGIPEMLVTDISQSQYVRPIPGERLLAVMRDLGVADHTRFDEVALQAISERAPADSVLYGQFVQSGGQVRLNLTLRQADSGVPTPLQAEGSTENVFELVDQITGLVKQHLDLTDDQIRGDTDRPIADVSTDSYEALIAYQSGLADLRQGANQAAIESFSKATAADGEFAMAHAKLAEAYLNLSNFHEAEGPIERARELSENVPLPPAERHQIHATAALVRDDYETAVESLSQLAKLYPNDPDVTLSLARALEELGNVPEALAAYTRVVEMSPSSGAALLGLGRAQVMSGAPDKAVTSLQSALDSGVFADDLDSMGMIHSILGVAYREMSEFDTAIEHLNTSLDYREKAGDANGQGASLFNLAAIHEARGDIDEALAAERRALELFRNMGDRAGESVALNSIALTYKVAGDLDNALESFRESFQIEMERQDHAELANRLDQIADIYRLKGQYDDAIVYLQQAKSHIDQSSDVQERAINLHRTGLVRRAQGLYEEAVEAFMEALPLFQEIHQDMGAAMVLHNLGEIYMSQGRYSDAGKSLSESLSIYEHLHVEHDIAEVTAPLARLLIAMGRLEEAEQALEGAAHVAHGAHADNVMPTILLGRAELAFLRGQEEAAAEAFEEANYQANLSGQKEVAVESRVALGRLFLSQGKLPNAERMLTRTRREAAESRLRPLEAAALTELAEVQLAKGDASAARGSALEAIDIAEEFSGRPTLYKAYASLGRALEKLDRNDEAIEAYVKAAETLEWMRAGLNPDHVSYFVKRPDVREFLVRTSEVLEASGRSDEAAKLKQWVDVDTDS